MTVSLWGVMACIIGVGFWTMANFIHFRHSVIARRLDRIGLPFAVIGVIFMIAGLFFK